jgi:hypothetical protein
MRRIAKQTWLCALDAQKEALDDPLSRILRQALKDGWA